MSQDKKPMLPDMCPACSNGPEYCTCKKSEQDEARNAFDRYLERVPVKTSFDNGFSVDELEEAFMVGYEFRSFNAKQELAKEKSLREAAERRYKELSSSPSDFQIIEDFRLKLEEHGRQIESLTQNNGFWGRACIRLSQKNNDLESQLAQAKEEIERLNSLLSRDGK